MVPMHLGLIDRPFVPHNLISAQESLVPLPKFQVAPRLNLNVLWVEERNPDILSFSLKKSWQVNPPPDFPTGPLWREMPAYIAFLYLFISKALRKERSQWKQTPIPEPYLTYLSGPQVQEPFLQVPLMVSPWRDMPCS
jgi:hypothetical protein